MIQKVFIIDDDPVSIRLSEFILTHEQFAAEIITFLDPKDALAAMLQDLSGNLPEYVFLDLNMPFMDGWQFLNHLEPFIPQLKDKTKIYILTSSVAPEDKKKANDFQLVAGFIEKPLDEGLLAVLRQQGKK